MNIFASAHVTADQRAPERVRHALAEMIRYRALLIAASYPDGKIVPLVVV